MLRLEDGAALLSEAHMAKWWLAIRGTEDSQMLMGTRGTRRRLSCRETTRPPAATRLVVSDLDTPQQAVQLPDLLLDQDAHAAFFVGLDCMHTPHVRWSGRWASVRFLSGAVRSEVACPLSSSTTHRV